MPKVRNYVRDDRENLDMTQLTLSRLANVTPAAVSQIEHGKRMPNIETALKLALALGTRVGDLFELVDDEEEEEAT